jgi:hypothetical protein
MAMSYTIWIFQIPFSQGKHDKKQIMMKEKQQMKMEKNYNMKQKLECASKIFFIIKPQFVPYPLPKSVIMYCI